jgi:hypothetical protein
MPPTEQFSMDPDSAYSNNPMIYSQLVAPDLRYIHFAHGVSDKMAVKTTKTATPSYEGE